MSRPVFPTMLRKMWSGGEVQKWLDENVQASPWIPVSRILPEKGLSVLVYSPENGVDFDMIDEDCDSGERWYVHGESYEHYCSVAKPAGSTGPSEKAPYTHWMEFPMLPKPLTCEELVAGGWWLDDAFSERACEVLDSIDGIHYIGVAPYGISDSAAVLVSKNDRDTPLSELKQIHLAGDTFFWGAP